MTYQEFKNKYNETYVDYDGFYGSQCWDLAQKYFTEVLNIPPYVLGGVGLVSGMLYGNKRKDLDTYFKEISKDEVIEGDIAIWEYGHIAIVDNINNELYFSQNPNPCRVIQINIKGVHYFTLKDRETKRSFKYLNLKPSVNSWTVYKSNNYYIPTNTDDVLARLNPMKFDGLSYKILEDMGNYHFKIQTDMFGIGYIAGNPYKYDCSITNTPVYKNGNY